MFTLRRSPRFVRKLKKLLKKDRALQASFLEVFEQLERDPTARSLRSHKVLDIDGKPAFSSFVTGDLRIIWRYAEDELDVLDLTDVGGHSGAKKVYR